VLSRSVQQSREAEIARCGVSACRGSDRQDDGRVGVYLIARRHEIRIRHEESYSARSPEERSGQNVDEG
jgi:hypothetical protein